jgi:hypothetical protein
MLPTVALSWYGNDEGVKGPPGLPAATMSVVGVTCNDGMGWTKTHAAPMTELSPGPPTMAVLPAESATERPPTLTPGERDGDNVERELLAIATAGTAPPDAFPGRL